MARHDGRGRGAKAQPLGVIKRVRTDAKIFASEFFAEEVRREILDRFGEDKLYGGGLSVRTTLDPSCSAWPAPPSSTALSPTITAIGWRGPVKKIDIKGGLGQDARGMPVWSDIDPWRLAVVLRSPRTAPRSAAPRAHSGRRLVKERETGTIPYEEVKWARPKVEASAARRASVSAVLKPGDVVYVSPRLPKPAADGTPARRR